MTSSIPNHNAKSITLIFAAPLEFENAAKNRALSFTNEFLMQGYQVILISNDRPEYELLTNPQFIHSKVKAKNTKIKSFIKRGLLEGENSYNLLKHAHSFDSSLILISIPSMFLLHLSFLLPKDKTIICDIRDLSWEYLSENSLLTKNIKKLFRWSAKKNINRFDIISVTNDEEFQYLNTIMTCSKINLVKIPNGVSQASYETLSQVTGNTTTQKTITYIGNVGLAQDLSTLLLSAKALPQYHFNIVGNGTDMERIQALYDELSLPNVTMWGQQSFDKLISIYSNSDILYAQLTPDYSGAMPSKLYEYLATGKFIVYGGTGLAPSILNQYPHTKTVVPQDPQALTKALSSVLDESNPNVNFIHMDNRNYIKNHFIRETMVRDIFKYIE